MPGTPPLRPRGFTIIELIVVVGIITVLLSLLLPALASVQRRGAKAREKGHLRQVGIAWVLYGSTYDDATLPGYLTPGAQQSWRVRFFFPDGGEIPPAPDYPPEDEEGRPNVAGPWPWRLMPYLDDSWDVVMQHRGEGDAFAMTDRAWEVRNEPAFGYNGLFVGGWWTSRRGMWFDRARTVDDNEHISVVSRTIASIRHPSRLITFIPSAVRFPGVHRYDPRLDETDGSFMIIPPILGSFDMWGTPTDPGLAGLYTIERYGSNTWYDATAPEG